MHPRLALGVQTKPGQAHEDVLFVFLAILGNQNPIQFSFCRSGFRRRLHPARTAGPND
jgi:hypothetical protein